MVPGRSCPRAILPQPICPICILLLGALLPNTDEGTNVGMVIAPAVVAAAFFKNTRLFMASGFN
jgi:hypothetical protein